MSPLAAGQVDDVEHLLDAARAPRRRRGRPSSCEVLPAGQVGVELRALDEPGDAVQRARRRARCPGPAEHLAACRRRAGSARTASAGTSSCPAPFGPEDAVHLALGDADGDAVDGGQLAVPLGQALGAHGQRSVTPATLGSRHEATMKRSRRRALPGGTLPAVRVLIAEDEPRLADLLAQVARPRPAGRRRCVRRTGRRRWRAARDAAAYDVLLLDWMLPGLEGPAVCRSAARPRAPHAGADAHRPRHARRPGRTGSTPAPTTTWPSPSSSTSCSPGCGPCTGAADPTRSSAAARRRPGGRPGVAAGSAAAAGTSSCPPASSTSWCC